LNRITYWYQTRGRKNKQGFIIAGLAAGFVGVVLLAYILLVPSSVEVKYGTIVKDPVDGRVWEDNTKVKTVSSDEAEKYTVTYVDKLSPEHEQQKAAEEAAAAEKAAQQAQLQGLEKLSIPITNQQLINLRVMLDSVDTTGTNVVDGIELSNALSQTRSKLAGYRDQVASMSVTSELEGFKSMILTVFDKYIQACDLYLLAVQEVNESYMRQANALVNEANAMIPGVD
jgi:hypothetical protein